MQEIIGGERRRLSTNGTMCSRYTIVRSQSTMYFQMTKVEVGTVYTMAARNILKRNAL